MKSDLFSSALFYIVVPLGLEDVAKKEIMECWPFLQRPQGGQNHLVCPLLKVEMGGVEFEAPLWAGLELHFFLKVSSRILLRLASFRLRQLDQLKEYFMRMGLKNFVLSGRIHLAVACSESFFNNEKKIFSEVENAFKGTYQVTGKKEEGLQGIYVRVHRDQCTISIDATGAHLHKRGYKTLSYAAPLRATLASVMLRELVGETSLSELNEICLVDPVCGSGTLLLEAARWADVNPMRFFAFQSWQITPRFLKAPHCEVWLKESSQSAFARLLGLDQSAEALEKTTWHAVQAKVGSLDVEVVDWSRYEAVQRVKKTLGASKSKDERYWLVGNLPYGERLEDSISDEGFAHMEAIFQPEKVIFLGKNLKQRQWPKAWGEGSYKKLRNGGIWVDLAFFSRTSV